jgi:hypothetical protein
MPDVPKKKHNKGPFAICEEAYWLSDWWFSAPF